MNLDEKIFMKTIYDEIGHFSCFPIYPVTNKVRSAAMVDGGLKNLSVQMKTIFVNYTEDLKSAVARYAKHKEITNKSFKEQLILMFDDVRRFIEETGFESIPKFEKRGVKPTGIVHIENKSFMNNTESGTSPISDIVDALRRAIKTCDHNITFINATYNLRPDPRYCETSVQRVMEMNGPDNVYYSINNEFDWNNIGEMEKRFKEKGVELFSPEYRKLITKRLRAFKAEIISNMNKYFGAQSVFAEFNIPDLVL